MVVCFLRMVIVAICFLEAAGCSEQTKREGSPVRKEGLARSLSGHAISSAILPNAKIDVYLLRHRMEARQLIASSFADQDGVFKADVEDADGPFEIHVSADGQRKPFRLYARGDQREGLVVSPLSSLSAALADYRIAKNASLANFDLVTVESDALLESHFQLPPLHTTLPRFIDQPYNYDGALGTASLTGEDRVGFVLAALREMADEFAEAGASTDGQSQQERLERFVATLSEDLSADGTLDGLGAGRQPLKLSGVPYDGAILRQRTAKAVLRLAAAREAVTQIRPQQVCDWCEKIVSSRSAVVVASASDATFACFPGKLAIKGSVFVFSEQRDGIDVVVRELSPGGQRGAEIARTTTDVLGEFSVSVPTDVASFWIEASRAAPAGLLYSVLVPELAETGDTGVHLHPFSSLLSIYASTLLKTTAPVEAHAKARNTFGVHFGGPVDHRVRPTQFFLENYLAGGQTQLDPQQRLYLLQVGFARLGQRAKKHGSTIDRDADLFATLRLLDADVQADGRFDGRVLDAPLRAATGYALSDDTLHGHLGAAVLAELREAQLKLVSPAASEDASSVRAIRTFAHFLAGRSGGPFVGEVDTIDDKGPVFRECVVLTGDDQARDTLGAFGGTVRMRCVFDSRYGCSRIKVTSSMLQQNDLVVDPAPKPHPAEQKEDLEVVGQDEIAFVIHTSAMSTRLTQDQFLLELVLTATDVIGASSSAHVFLNVDNSLPSVECTNCRKVDGSFAAYLPRHSTLQMNFESAQLLTDVRIVSNGGLKGLTIRRAAETQKDSSFLLNSSPLATEGAYPVQLLVRDERNNESNVDLVVHVVDEPVSVEWIDLIANDQFTPSGGFSLFRRLRQVPDAVPVMHRFPNELDDLPTRETEGMGALPMVRASVHAWSQGNAAVTVEYRATAFGSVDFANKRSKPTDWRAMKKNPDGTYGFLVSYQSLLNSTDGATLESRRAAAHLLHTDDKGRGPAPWQVEVRVTDVAGQTATSLLRFVIDARLPPVEIDEFAYSAQWRDDLYEAINERHEGIQTVGSQRFRWPVRTMADASFQLPTLKVMIRESTLETVATRLAWHHHRNFGVQHPRVGIQNFRHSGAAALKGNKQFALLFPDEKVAIFVDPKIIQHDHGLDSLQDIDPSRGPRLVFKKELYHSESLLYPGGETKVPLRLKQSWSPSAHANARSLQDPALRRLQKFAEGSQTPKWIVWEANPWIWSPQPLNTTYSFPHGEQHIYELAEGWETTITYKPEVTITQGYLWPCNSAEFPTKLARHQF